MLLVAPARARNTREVTRGPLAVLVGLGVAFAGASPAWAERIADIRIDGNTKTTDRTVGLIAGISRGDDLSPAVADRIRRDLVSSGLFRDVEVYWEAVPDGGGVRLVIVARDKHSWVIAPAFYNQPTNQGGGVGFGENNLFGENKKLLLYGQLASGDTFFIGAYVDPSIAATRFHWQFDVFLKSGRIFEYAAPDAWRSDPHAVRQSRLWYANTGVRFGVDLWKGVSFDLRLRGAKVGYSDVKLASDQVAIEEITGDPTSTRVPAPGVEGYDVSTELVLGIDTRANWYGIASGSRFVASFEHALPGLGSDFIYWYSSVQLSRAIRLLERHNLTLKGAIGYGHDLPFQQEYKAGGTAQRGWKNDQFRGDSKVTANVEYAVPLFTVKGLAVRGLGFVDASYLTFRDATDTAERDYLPGSDVKGLAPLKSSVGVGTRLYLRQIVLPLLGLDFGYGLERGAYEIYLAIGLTD